jgi:hypothetical protein
MGPCVRYDSNRIVISLTLDPRWVLAYEDLKFCWGRLVADDSRAMSAAMTAAVRVLVRTTMLRKEVGQVRRSRVG